MSCRVGHRAPERGGPSIGIGASRSGRGNACSSDAGSGHDANHPHPLLITARC